MQVKLKGKASLPTQLTMTIAGNKKTISISEAETQWVNAGEWTLKDTGYIAIQLAAAAKVRRRRDQYQRL